MIHKYKIVYITINNIYRTMDISWCVYWILLLGRFKQEYIFYCFTFTICIYFFSIKSHFFLQALKIISNEINYLNFRYKINIANEDENCLSEYLNILLTVLSGCI